MKEQVIAIFEAALANPAYLNPAFNMETGVLEDSEEHHEHANNWFCVITEAEIKKVGLSISPTAATECFDRIKQSIAPNAFLKSHLADNGIIGSRTEYDSLEYKIAAHAHWRALIEKIKSEK